MIIVYFCSYEEVGVGYIIVGLFGVFFCSQCPLLRLHLMENEGFGYRKEKLPSLKSQDNPLTGDFTYLLAIKERLSSSKQAKKDTNIPHNYFDFSGMLFYIPANLQLSVDASGVQHFYWYQRNFSNLYGEVSTPPPKMPG